VIGFGFGFGDVVFVVVVGCWCRRVKIGAFARWSHGVERQREEKVRLGACNVGRGLKSLQQEHKNEESETFLDENRAFGVNEKYKTPAF
jgi:hypothetical protein